MDLSLVMNAKALRLENAHIFLIFSSIQRSFARKSMLVKLNNLEYFGLISKCGYTSILM